ncbi:hypothetical protein [Proteiniphilum sp. X52]|uniref:hypothetical protein n=1 Tax=Proteiniphilum sp. X52 TaxID=2382159 RepID=UPI000F09EFCC|nr:hypothetical protein [Proteiniphilum sp. X52]RNC66440.1 hypothetical protein D7D25_02890 [Proteiniphilum sp. X52]
METGKTDMAVIRPRTTEIASTDNNVFETQKIDLNGKLPDLQNANEMPIDLCGNYWTPEKEGEVKRLYFVEIKPQKVLSSSGTGEIIDLDCAVFLEQRPDGTVQTITNGSRRLVGVLESYMLQGVIGHGTPLQITYMGKRKNKSNNFSSDSWSIKPLIIKIA